MVYFNEYDSPVGKLLLTCGETALTGLWMDREPPGDAVRKEDHPVLVQAAQWLDAYFRGEDTPVPIPLAPEGTAFQRQVWEILLTIGRGQTRTYSDIAREIARKQGKASMSAQAVGQAVGANPISILIPCHRCVGTQGKLTGYAGGLDRKVWLLRHEGWEIRENRIL